MKKMILRTFILVGFLLVFMNGFCEPSKKKLNPVGILTAFYISEQLSNQPDELESNNSFETAKCLDKVKVDRNGSFTLPYTSESNFDIDYFYVNLQINKVFTFYLYKSKYREIPFKIQIFDLNRTEIPFTLAPSNQTFDPSNNYSEVSYTTTYSGKHFLKIQPLEKRTNRYSMKILPNENSADLIMNYTNSCEGI